MQQGALVALPPSYFATSKDDLEKLTQPSGFQNFLGKTINKSDLDEKLDDSTRHQLESSLFLSEDAKLFGIMRELVSTNNFIVGTSAQLVDLIVLIGAYWYSYSKTRIFKLQLAQRRKIYMATALLSISLMLISRVLLQKYIETTFDIGK